MFDLDGYLNERKTMVEQELALQMAARDLQEGLSLKQRQKEEITGHSSKTLREAVKVVKDGKPALVDVVCQMR